MHWGLIANKNGMKKIIVSIFLIVYLISCKKELPEQQNDTPVSNNSTWTITQVPLIVPPSAPLAWTGSPSIESALTGSVEPVESESFRFLTQQKAAIELPPVDPLENAPKATPVKKDVKIPMKLWKYEFQSLKNKVITVDNIINWAKISNKFHLTGKVPKNWVYEWTFPIKIYDMSNGIISEWVWKADIFDKDGKVIQDKEVSFEADLDLFIPALTKKWILKIIADNPSGLPQNDDSVSINVIF